MQDVRMILSEVVLVVVSALILSNLSNGATQLVSVTNESLNLGTGTINGSSTNLAHNNLYGTALSLTISGKAAPTNPLNYTYDTRLGIIYWNSTVQSGNITATSSLVNATYQYGGTGYDPNTVNQMLYPYLSTFVLLAGLALIGYFNMI